MPKTSIEKKGTDLFSTDFDYPEEIAPLVRYMPLPERAEGSEERLFENWRTFLSNYKSILSQADIAKGDK
ncbi:DUF2247 family protein [Pseudomonas frederiksbergensis]|uniref:DUF2247 family protein n=1 Tax=Pseudomonas frederiksbergensis TaxID=104087 RepID=UPI003D053AD8